ncbi:MAG: GntR family transcriptional regulator [Mycolicibacterium cosmeticum]|nr:GntR family transcriptional regulator [Mycolicibacterium cosmeticum]
MPKRYGVNEREQVVGHVAHLILTGKLRSADRLDRNELAAELGVSRVPVQEAVAQLEHDGIVVTRYHRGAFIARFDARVLLEHYNLYGVLNGLVSAGAATEATHETVGRLKDLTGALRTENFHDIAWEYRQLLVERHAGPRLQAAIGASQTFIPRTFWADHLHVGPALLAHFDAETNAIADGDPDAARAACQTAAALMGRVMLAELVRRGVLAPLIPSDTY